MESIVIQLIEKRNKLELSVPKLAKELDIPADRIYKWEQDKGNPKGSDIDKINKWLGVAQPEVTRVEPDYKEELLQVLRQQVAEKGAIIESLLKDVKQDLQLLKSNSVDLLNNVAIGQVTQQIYSDMFAEAYFEKPAAQIRQDVGKKVRQVVSEHKGKTEKSGNPSKVS